MPKLTEATDADLRIITFQHEHVIAKFIDEDCPICKELAPAYKAFSTSAEYRKVYFLVIHASENPVSSKEVKLSGTPFISTYKKGILQTCGLVSNEAGIKQMLNKLLKE